MSITEFKATYSGMSPRQVRELISANEAFRKEISRIYCNVMHQAMNLRCKDCYMDAFIVIMTTPTEKIESMERRQFELRAGALLFDVVEDDRSKTATHHNLTDELALYHLRTNPSYIRFFSKYPDNWEELAKASANCVESNEISNDVETTTEGEKRALSANKVAKTRSNRAKE